MTEILKGFFDSLIKTAAFSRCFIFHRPVCSLAVLGVTFRFPYGKKREEHKLLSFFGDPYGNRTHVTAVKGRCLNRLTNGPGSGDLT